MTYLVDDLLTAEILAGSDRYVVDQPGFAEPCRRQHAESLCAGLGLLEGYGVAHGDVVDLAEAGGAEGLGSGGLRVGGHGTRTDFCGHFADHAMDHGRNGPLLRAQVGITGTHREAVRLADRLLADDGE